MRATWCLALVSLAIVYGKNLDSISPASYKIDGNLQHQSDEANELIISSKYLYFLDLKIVIIPPERVPSILKASAKCIENLKLDKDTLEKYFAWQLSDSDSTRKYIFCLGNESGYFADDGSLIKNETFELFGSHRERVVGVIEECNKIKYDDKYETIYRAVTCFYEKSKLQFKV